MRLIRHVEVGGNVKRCRLPWPRRKPSEQLLAFEKKILLTQTALEKLAERARRVEVEERRSNAMNEPHEIIQNCVVDQKSNSDAREKEKLSLASAASKKIRSKRRCSLFQK